MPKCSARCDLVAGLLAEIARLTGTSEQYQRVAHGLPTEDGRCPRCGRHDDHECDGDDG